MNWNISVGDFHYQFSKTRWEDYNEIIGMVFVKDIFNNAEGRKSLDVFNNSVDNQICFFAKH